MPDVVTRLEAELREVDTHTTPGGRERALALVRAELEARPRAGRPRRRWLGVPRPVAIAIAIGLLIAASFTPPGRAVAGWIEDLLSGADETKPQTSGQRLFDAVRVGDGAAGGEVYTIFADLDRDEDLCLHVRWIGPPVGSDRQNLEACRLVAPPPDELRVPFIESIGAEEVFVLGLAPAETSRVELRFPRRAAVDGETALFEVGPGLFGLNADFEEFKLFAGTLPARFGDASAAEAPRAVAYAGEVPVASARVAWITAQVGGKQVVLSCDAKPHGSFGRCPR